MTATHIGEHARVREIRLHAETAVAAALNQDWAQAIAANRAILRLTQDNVEALNRLAKALMELGELIQAQNAVDCALQIDPANTISRRNRDRLERARAAAEGGMAGVGASGNVSTNGATGDGRGEGALRAAAADAAAGLHGADVEARVGQPAGSAYSGHLLMSETGKTVIASLIDAADRAVIGRLSGGEALTLARAGNRVFALSCRGAVIGRVHPLLAQRMCALMDIGYRYEAAFLRDHPVDGVHIVIGEVYRHPSQAGRPSFPPVHSEDGFRGYVRNTHDLVSHGLGGPPARDPSEDDDEPPEVEALIRAHDRGELGHQSRGAAGDGLG